MPIIGKKEFLDRQNPYPSHTDYSQTELSRLQIFEIIFTSHEFLTAVVIETVSLIVLTPCRPVSGYQHFGGLNPGDGGRTYDSRNVSIHPPGYTTSHPSRMRS